MVPASEEVNLNSGVLSKVTAGTSEVRLNNGIIFRFGLIGGIIIGAANALWVANIPAITKVNFLYIFFV
jgi:hypothetical protein